MKHSDEFKLSGLLIPDEYPSAGMPTGLRPFMRIGD